MPWNVNLGFIVPSLEISVNEISATILYKVGDWNFTCGVHVIGILRGEKKEKEIFNSIASSSRNHVHVKQFSFEQVLLIAFVHCWEFGGHSTQMLDFFILNAVSTTNRIAITSIVLG